MRPLGDIGTDDDRRRARVAVVALASVTVVTLLAMALTLSRDPVAPTSERSAPSADADRRAKRDADPTTSTTTLAEPGLERPVPDLDDMHRWATPLEADRVACAGPTLVGAVVSIQCNNTTLIGFDATTGSQLWATEVNATPVMALVSPPVAAGDELVLFSVREELTAVDATTGAIAWIARRESDNWAMAASADTLGVYRAGHLAALEPATGDERWEVPLPDGVFDVGSISITFTSTSMILAVGSGMAAFDIDTGAARWSATNAKGEAVDVVAEGDSIATVGHRGLSLFDAATGKMRWTLDGHFAAHHPNIAGMDSDHVYAGSSEELTSVNRSDGSVAWSFTSEQATTTAGLIDVATFAEGSIITRVPGEVWQVDAATGAVVATVRMATSTSGVARDGRLYELEGSGPAVMDWVVRCLDLVET